MKPYHHRTCVPFLVLWLVVGLLSGRSWAQDPQTHEQSAETEASTTPVPVKSPFAGAWPGEKRQVDISFDAMDVYPVLDFVLSQVLEYNYVVDPAIKGTISLHVQGAYSKQELLDVFNSILQINGLAVTKGEQNLYKVVRKPDSAKTGTDVLQRGEKVPHGGDVIRVFQLKYLSAPNVVGNLKQLLSQGALIVGEPSVNAVIISDTAENVDKISRVLTLMDTDFFRDIEWRLFTLEHADVEDAAKDLEKIFQSKGLYGRQGLDTGAFQIMPLKTINALLVVTKWPELITLMETWITELDQVQSGKGQKIHVYYVQNGKAADIADLLQQIFGLKRTTSSKMDKGKKKVLVKGETKPAPETPRPSTAGESEGGNLISEAEIIPDEMNNALLIRARPQDYAAILDVLSKIDILPRQVLIEVLIVDVSLNKNIEYGVEWFLANRGIKLDGKSYSGKVTLDDGTTLDSTAALGAGVPGFAYGLFDQAGGLRALIRTLSEKTDVNILSAPNILAVDNQESSIEVGDDVPTLTGSTITEGGTTTQSVQYRNAGIILKVKPYINKNGLVRMELTQEVSSVTSASTGGITSPSFRTRKATTYLVTEDKQTIVIGGLMQTERTKNSSGIPILKDIPVLGYAFGSRDFKTNKTELLFIITPHVIQSREQADALTREFTDRVKDLRELLEQKKVPGLESGDIPPDVTSTQEDQAAPPDEYAN